MLCKNIYVENFRNIEQADVSFCDGVNVLIGDNAQGKTNLLEAIYLTALGRSFRQACDTDLIRFGQEMAFIRNIYSDSLRNQEISMRIFSGRKQKRIEHNRVKVDKMSDMIGSFKVVIFCPEHLSVVKEGPSLRRNFLDVALSQLRPLYVKSLQRYHAILKERNSLIKRVVDNRQDFDRTIDIWSEQLAREAVLITSYRIKYLRMAKGSVESCFADMTGEREKPTLTYVSSSGLSEDECLDEKLCLETYRKLYNSRHDREIGAGATLWGIHKDDIEICLNGKNSRIYCSQGQQRSLALSMKLAEGDIIKAQCGGDHPVFLLDDVFSELDSGRREYLTTSIKDKQVILTSCEPGIITEANVIRVKNGRFEK